MSTTDPTTLPCGCATTEEHAAVSAALDDPARFTDPTTEQPAPCWVHAAGTAPCRCFDEPAVPEPATPGQLDLDAIEARAERAHLIIVALAQGARWKMSIPAQPDRDHDLILDETVRDVERLVAEVRRLTAELDTAPGVYQLPAEPPDHVTELWDRDGDQWDRYDVRGGWSADDGDSIWPWPELVAEYGPLSTTPPASAWTCPVPGHTGIERDRDEARCLAPGCLRTSSDPPGGRGSCECELYDCSGGCCGPGQCSCSTGALTTPPAGTEGGSTRWTHIQCSHVQTFAQHPDPRTPGSGPSAGCHCQGCGHPTAVDDWELAAYAHCVYDCCRCHAPIPLGQHVIMTAEGYSGRGLPAHRRCAFAGDAELAEIRREACRQGHHQSPRQWTRDPADPYGDAAFWECVRGCGYVKRHPGYGIGKMIAAAEGVLPPEVHRAD